MRHSRFWALAEDEFGAAYARMLVASTHLAALGGRTAGEARWTCPRSAATGSTSPRETDGRPVTGLD